MKKIFLLLILAIYQNVMWSQQELFISLSMNDCSNCYNGLALLQKLDLNVKVIIKEEFQSDSASIVDVFKLNHKNISLRFSDKWYNQLIGFQQQSTMHIIKDGFIIGTYLLKDGLSDEFVQNVNNLQKDQSVMAYKNAFYGFSTQDIVFSGNKMLLFKPKEAKVSILDRFNQDYNRTISLTDSLGMIAYKKYFKDDEKANEEVAFFKNRGYAHLCTPYSVEVYNQKVYVGTSLRTLAVSDNLEDTFEMGFQCIYIFDMKGNFLHCGIVEEIFDQKSKEFNKHLFNEFIDTAYYVAVVNAFIPMDSSVAVSCTKVDVNQRLKHDNMLANFKMNKDGNYEFSYFYPFQYSELMQSYNYNYNRIFSSSDQQFFTIQLDDNIYDLGKNTIQQNRLSFNNKFDGNIFNVNQVTYDFKVKDKVAYWIYLDKKEKAFYYVTTHLDDQKISKKIQLTPLTSENYSTIFSIDPIDPTYVLVPIDKKTIKRYQP